MINNVSVIEHDKLILYSLDDFAMDEDLQECIRNAKVEAISLKNASCQVKEIGNGSANNTSVFCIPNPDISGEKLALKLVSYITTTYPPEYEADEAVRDLVNNTPKSNRVIDEIINSLKTKDCRNVIPLSGHDTIIWKCPKYNRIGIDYALKMPLAACINDTISKYVVRHNTGTNALLTEEKPETEKTILEIGIDLCIALQDLHAHGIIHRDIKPGNIFLYKEHYCLGDFGIAVENPSSQDFRVGTQDYWAPEQAGDMFSDKYDHRMDIYSLGLVLYELADTMSVSMHYRDRMKGQSLPDLSSVSKGLNKILHKACQFDPDNRYQNAEAFWADLHLLQNKHDYIPVYQAPEESHEYATSKNKSAGTPSNTAYSSSQKRNPYGRKQARKKLEDFIISPETVWNAGKFWYDESCKRGNRFSGFDIDRRIMPLSVTSNHVIDLPVNVVTDQETVKNQKPLSEIISNIEKLHNMYLIGEGGIGKTTALYSIMKDAYREKLPSKSENEKQIIPLFIELSKAPAEYCSVYESSHSTFIRRYLFMLINSFHSQHLISESAVEMTRIMQMDMIFSVQKIDALLRKSPNNVQYLLLLDGLNEVARKQLSIPGNDYMGSPLEFIVSEIHELLKHSNVSVIITSRADETLGDSKNIFDRLYLTGVSKRAIKKYLTQHEISYKRVKENKRLIETLRIPLFLKLYSQLYSTSEVSTPGEILYAFFSERSAKYTIRNRISEIKADHRMSGENPASNRIDEKLQWFILDFLLPELGWYMEKKDLYTVNLETIKQVVDSVLKGTSETDICGKYGKAMFCDYHNGKDGSVNTRTYADQLLHLNLSRQSYIQTIVDYCVYSFGILYVNNQNYGFIHQHIRDFFAALKIITDIKFANSILHTDKITAIHRLSELNNNMLSASVSQFLSDLSIPLSSKSKSDFYSNALNIYRNVFDTSSGIGVKNIIEILYKVKGNLADMNFSNLDLRKCQLYGINLERSSFAEAKLSKNTLFFKGHNSSIRNAGFSPDGKHIFSIEYDDTLRTWNTHALAEENIFSREAIMRPMAAKYSVSGKLFFVIYFIEGVTRNYTIYVYDSGSMKCIKQKKILYTTHNSEVGMSVEKGEHFNFVEISPDDKYLIIGDIFNTILLDPIQKDENNKRYIHSFRTNLNQALRILVYSLKKQFLSTVSLDLSPQILADPLKQYIVAAFPYNDNIVFYSADTLEEEFKISLPEKKYFSKRLCICPSGRFLAVFMDFNIYILDIQKRMIFRTRTWDRKTGKLNPTSCKFINFNSETCMLLKYETGRNGANPYYFKYIVVSGNSRELLIFDPLTGKYVDRIGTTDNYTWKYTWKVSYHAETKQLAVVLDNGSVALYRYQNNTFVHQKTVKMMDEYIGELKFSPKGDKLLTISYIGNILCIYNILSEKLITLDKVNSIHKSDAFAYLDTDTSGTPPNYDDTVVEVTTAPGKAVQTSRNYTFRGNGTFSYPDGDTVLASFQNADSIGYFDSATGKFKGINHAYYEPYRKNIMHKLYKKSQDFPWSIGMRQVDSIAYNRDGTYLFITRHGGRVEIWSTFTGKCLAILKAFNADAKKLAVSDDGDYIAFSTCGPNIKIYRMCDIHTTDSFDLCYSDNITDWKCKYNIRGEWRFQVRKSANKLYHFIYKTQEGHKQPIAGMEFSPDKKQLLTTAYDRSVKIWDLSDASRDQYNISPHCLYSIEFIPGLKVKGAVIQNLHSSSNLTDKELESLKTYGAIL